MTKEEILDETVAFYSVDTRLRAMEDSGCKYNTNDGRHCAIGRCLKPIYHAQGTLILGNGVALERFLSKNGLELDDMLEEKYRGHSIAFWGQVQALHDTSSFWGLETGLSSVGEGFVSRFKEKIRAGEFK